MGYAHLAIEKFLTAYTKNELNTIHELLDSDISIQYSTIGEYHGKEQVLQNLSFNQKFDINTVTITNEISYNENDNKIIYLMAHHMVANEQGSTLYPLCFGGKYVFRIDLNCNIIKSIHYSQEYQVENTLYIKEWKKAKRFSDLSIIENSFDVNKAYESILTEADTQQKFVNLARLYCLALDCNNIDLLKKMSTDDIQLLRPKTMSYGKFMANQKSEIATFIQECKSYYSMDQYSIKVNSSVDKQDCILLNISHLIPHRTGTKKLNVNTKYHSFFDEDINITFSKENSSYPIKSFICKKITDVHYNGFDLLRFD